MDKFCIQSSLYLPKVSNFVRVTESFIRVFELKGQESVFELWRDSIYRGSSYEESTISNFSLIIVRQDAR